jgi:hypothetical protein
MVASTTLKLAALPIEVLVIIIQLLPRVDQACIALSHRQFYHLILEHLHKARIAELVTDGFSYKHPFRFSNHQLLLARLQSWMPVGSILCCRCMEVYVNEVYARTVAPQWLPMCDKCLFSKCALGLSGINDGPRIAERREHLLSKPLPA